MKILSFLKGKPRGAQSPQETSRCTHPAKFVFPLHEDKANPKKVTGLKCSQCGDRLPVPEAKSKAA